MAKYDITSPDGDTYEVEAPDTASEQEVLAYAKAQFQSTPGGAAVGNPNLRGKRQSSGVPATDAFLPGVNKGISHLVGLPVDTVANVANLGIAGAGVLTGTTPGLIENPIGGSNSIQQLINKIGIRTANPNPQDPASQMLHTAGSVIGGSAIPVGGAVRTAASVVPAAAGAAVAEQIDPRFTGVGALTPATVAHGARNAATGARNAVVNKVNAKFETPHAKEGLELEKETGIRLTHGGITGDAGINAVENAARQSFFTRNKVLKSDQEIAGQAIKRVEDIADKISATQYGPGPMGETVQSALTNAVKKIDILRDKNASIDYGKVRQIGGNQPIIAHTNTVTELRKIIDQYDNVAGGDAQKISNQAKAMLDRLTEKVPVPELPARVTVDQLKAHQELVKIGPTTVPKTVTVNEAQRTRSFYSKASAGTGNVFDDISPNLNRTLASRLARAADDDFLLAEKLGNGPVHKALSEANRNYAAHSKSLEYVQTSVLGKMLGKDVADAALTGARGNTVAGEEVARKILTMHPSQAKTVSNILSQTAPHVLADTKAFVLRQALEKGMDIPGSAGANTIPLSYNKFIKALPKDDYLEAMRFSPNEIIDIKRTQNAMLRAGDRTGWNPSGTAPMNQIIDTLKAIAGLSVKSVVSAAGPIVGLNAVAKAMASRGGRSALRIMSDPKSSPTQLNQALAVISAEDASE
jgi:hypothetical protein